MKPVGSITRPPPTVSEDAHPDEEIEEEEESVEEETEEDAIEEPVMEPEEDPVGALAPIDFRL